MNALCSLHRTEQLRVELAEGVQVVMHRTTEDHGILQNPFTAGKRTRSMMYEITQSQLLPKIPTG